MGLIHRDIKPANIYVCRMGIEYDFITVHDFGLVVREYRADVSTSRTEAVAMGTPAYMAPETILGHEPDRRVDIYAIGCLLCFVLTGEPVFRSRNDIDHVMQHVHAAPTPPSHSAEQPIPKSVDDLVLECLQKDPALRPASVDQVLRCVMTGTTGDVWDEDSARK
jgi:serine/threonine protein kinase